MRRLSVLVLALAALTALFASCGGGGEEAGVLAVAFRLDEGSPLMSAYIGDPAEDPFELPPGRYYIEVLDQDDVVVSLGAVDIEEGEAVDLPPSLAADGLADPERAEPLKTLANFLVDAELAEYAFLEIVSGGFELPLFDPDVEVTAADVETLFGMYEEILAQKDGVLAAFREIQGRAEVSGHSRYVSSRWAQDGEDLDRPFARMQALFGDLQTAPFGQEPDWKEQMRAEQEAEASLAKETHWVMTWNRDLQTGVLRPGFTLEKTLEWEEKHREWEHYAKRLVEELPGADEQAALAQAQKELDGAIRSDFEAWLAKNGATDFPADAVDVFVNYFVAETFAAAGQPVSVPTPPSGFWGASTPAAPTPDTGWIENYVQAVGEQWVDEGYGVEAVVAAESLRQCLTAAAEAGASRDEAIAQCPAKAFKPTATPNPTETPAAEETEAPAAEETETPAPEPTEEPAADTSWIEGYVQGIANQWLDKGYSGIDVAVAADDLRQCLTEAVQAGASRDDAIGECPPWLYEPKITPTPTPETTPTPEPKDVTAVGRWVNISLPGLSLNTLTLRFNTAGGPVSGEGHVTSQIPPATGVSCPPGTLRQTDVFEGTYSPDTGEFSGTWQNSAEGSYYVPVFNEDTTQECEERPYGQAPTSGSWHGTLQDGVVVGYRGAGESGNKFELTVQGP